EPVWMEVLADAEAGTLKPVYQPSRPFDLSQAPVPHFDLAARTLYRDLFLAQIGFCGLSLLVPVTVSRVRGLRFLLLTTMFTLMNAALLVGFWRWLARKPRGIWDPTPRQT